MVAGSSRAARAANADTAARDDRAPSHRPLSPPGHATSIRNDAPGCRCAWDGWVARRRNESSKAGAVLDILGDREVETTYWIAFASFGWIPVWVAVLVAACGIVVDGVRALALERGLTASGPTSMMRPRLGALRVSSRPGRGACGLGKAAAFTLVILAFAPGWRPSLETTLAVLAYGCVHATVALCVVRGLPVLVEARRFLAPERAG